MKLLAQAALLAIALIVDASLALTLPLPGGRPLLFAAFATAVALREGALAGGAWGFGGGLGLGLLFADGRIGARALGGLLAGSVPIWFRRIVFVHRWTGQLAIGVVSGGLYGATLLAVSWARGDVTGVVFPLLPWLALDAVLTGVAAPVFVRLLDVVERRV
ncbi:MAG: hypothetical protein AAB152_11310 [Candidatus Coatesbacteria bacterium]